MREGGREGGREGEREGGREAHCVLVLEQQRVHQGHLVE